MSSDIYGSKKNLLTKYLRETTSKVFTVWPLQGNMTELKKICEGEYGIQLKHTPQHNGVMEEIFLGNAKHKLPMMILAGWTNSMQGVLLSEATKTAALLGILLPYIYTNVPPDEQFNG